MVCLLWVPVRQPMFYLCLFSVVCSVLLWHPGGGTPYVMGDTYVPRFWPPFFTLAGSSTIFLGYFFSSTNSKAIFWGTKTTNFYKNRSFWPQIQFFPRSFWVQFSVASGTPPSVFRPSTPPPTPGVALDHFNQNMVYILKMYFRADSRFAPSQWEMVLLCNNVSHWLGASLESALYMIVWKKSRSHHVSYFFCIIKNNSAILTSFLDHEIDLFNRAEALDYSSYFYWHMFSPSMMTWCPDHSRGADGTSIAKTLWEAGTLTVGAEGGLRFEQALDTDTLTRYFCLNPHEGGYLGSLVTDCSITSVSNGVTAGLHKAINISMAQCKKDVLELFLSCTNPSICASLNCLI